MRAFAGLCAKVRWTGEMGVEGRSASESDPELDCSCSEYESESSLTASRWRCEGGSELATAVLVVGERKHLAECPRGHSGRTRSSVGWE